MEAEAANMLHCYTCTLMMCINYPVLNCCKKMQKDHCNFQVLVAGSVSHPLAFWFGAVRVHQCLQCPFQQLSMCRTTGKVKNELREIGSDGHETWNNMYLHVGLTGGVCPSSSCIHDDMQRC